jgi:hypothetical protein
MHRSVVGITASRGAFGARSCSVKGHFNRKKRIEQRLRELAEIFSVSVGAFSVLDNHLHA